MKVLNLYTTLGCHLCATALEEIDKVIDAFPGVTVKEVEIADSDELLEAYGVRIPVIRLEGSEQELGWPFDSVAVRQYLSEAL